MAKDRDAMQKAEEDYFYKSDAACKRQAGKRFQGDKRFMRATSTSIPVQKLMYPSSGQFPQTSHLKPAGGAQWERRGRGKAGVAWGFNRLGFGALTDWGWGFRGQRGVGYQVHKCTLADLRVLWSNDPKVLVSCDWEVGAYQGTLGLRIHLPSSSLEYIWLLFAAMRGELRLLKREEGSSTGGRNGGFISIR